MDYTEDIIENRIPGAYLGLRAKIFISIINALFVSQSTFLPERTNLYPTDYGPLLKDGDEFDFIIVGAGSAGSIIANRLTENKDWNILLLEAGGIPSIATEIPSTFFDTQLTEEDWKYYAEPSPHACHGMKNNSCYWPRGKVMGGCSATNAMIYVRGSRHDYDSWAKMGNEGWDYDSLIPYFKKIERINKLSENSIYGNDGNIHLQKKDSQHPVKYAIQKSASKFGYDKEDHENLMGFFDLYNNINRGVRHSTSQAYVSVLTNKNFRLAMKSTVTKVLIDRTTKTATGVQVKIGEKTINLRAKKEVILSSGAINSPMILMHSGIGPENHLKKLKIDVIQNLPVGENLQDHAMHIGFVVKVDEDGVIKKNVYTELADYFLHREGAFSGIDLTNFVGFINTKNNTNHPNIQYHNIIFAKNDLYLLPTILGVVNYKDVIVQSMLNYNKKNYLHQFMATLLQPKSRGRVLLKSSNPFDKPIIQANYLKEEEDVETFLEAIKFIEKLLKTEPLSNYNPQILQLDIPECNNIKFKSEKYWRCSLRNTVTTVYHPVGTCKMGKIDDETTVVDSKLRVKQIKNLRVADASIMPNIVSANTNAAAMVIGEKVSDLIKDDWNEIRRR